MRVIVCGSRGFTNEADLFRELDHLALIRRFVVVHGACPTGADALASQWCGMRGVKEWRFPADWQKHGKRAGFVRNAEMVAAGGDLCIAGWDGDSNGTLDTIKRATKAGIPVRIVPAKRKESPSGDGGGKP